MRLIATAALALVAGCSHNTPLRVMEEPPRPYAERPAVELADAVLAAGAPAVALSVADFLLKVHPGNYAARLRKGQAEYRLGELDAARASFETVLSEQPQSFEAQVGLGRIELATDAAAAQARFQRLAALQPNNATVLTNLGIAYDLLGQHELGQKMYHAALAVAPDLVSARSNLGLSLALSAQPKAALQVLRPLDATQTQSAQLRENLATVLAGQGGGGAGAASGVAPVQTEAPPRPVRPDAGS